MGDVEAEHAFQALKPACHALLKSLSPQTISNVVSLIEAIPDDVLQQIHAFAMFPFATHLKKHYKKNQSNLRIALAQGLHLILTKIHADSRELFCKFYSILISQLLPKQSQETVNHLDEDLALVVYECLTLLTVRLKPTIRMKIYTRDFAPEIGHGLFLGIQVARNHKYKKLKYAAVEFVMALCTVHNDVFKELHGPYIDPKTANTVGEILMFFLPGLLGGLLEISQYNKNPIETTNALSVRAIRRIISIVMLDKPDQNKKELNNSDFVNLITNFDRKSSKKLEESDPFGNKLRLKGKDGIEKYLATANRDETWYKAAGIKLTVITRSLHEAKFSPLPNFQYELVMFCSDLIDNCFVHMTPSMKYILEILICLMESENSSLELLCENALKSFSSKTHGNKEIINIIEQNFYEFLSNVPRLLNCLDENVRISNLNMLRGYVRFLTMNSGENDQNVSKLEEMLSSPFILNRFMLALLEIFRMEEKCVTLLDDTTFTNIGCRTNNSTPWKTFVYLSSNKCIHKAFDIFKILGTSNVVYILTDFLFEYINSENKKEVYLILNEIICCPTDDVSKKEHLIKTMINTYIEPGNWYLQTRVSKYEKPISKKETLDVSVYNPRGWTKEFTPGLFEGTVETRYTDISSRPPESDEEEEDGPGLHINMCSTIMQAKNNVIKMCLMTEGIGMAASALEEKFQPYLLKTLYILLERSGSRDEFLHLSGLRALWHVSKAFYLNGIPEIIQANSDYFTHVIQMKLRKIADNQGVIQTLLVVMHYGESSILSCLFEIVDNALHQCFKIDNFRNATLYMRLFQAFVRYVDIQFVTENFKIDDDINTVTTKRIDVIQQVMDYKMNNTKSTNFDDKKGDVYEENGDSGNTDETGECFKEGDIDEKEVPKHINMVAAVISKTLNYIPSVDKERKILAMNVLVEGFPIIKEYEDICLPLVHKVWGPLINRFKEVDQHLVIQKAFELLVVLGTVSGDFIKARTLKEVIPYIYTFLLKSSTESLLKDKGSIYRQGSQYKLQLCVLKKIGNLCILLKFNEHQRDTLMESAYVYLSCNQPIPLQTATVGLFKKLMEKYPASTWLFLKSSSSHKTVSPPECLRGSIVLNVFACTPAKKSEKSDFDKNLLDLLEHYNTLYGNTGMLVNANESSSSSDYSIETE